MPEELVNPEKSIVIKNNFKLYNKQQKIQKIVICITIRHQH